jgi:hypothetical protein
MQVSVYPEEANQVERDESGSHVVEYHGGWALIRDVELFAENSEHPDLGKADRAMLARIVEFTNARAAAGRAPHLVIRHAKGGDVVDQASYGTVENLRVAEGEPAMIHGDLRVRRSDLWTFSRYPRRSAEIFKVDGTNEGSLWLGNLALIGREIPRSDIPDVSLNDGQGDSPPVLFESEVPPVVFGGQEPNMDKKEVAKFINEMDDDERKEFVKQFSDDEKPEDDKKKDDDKSENSSGDTPATSDSTAKPVAFSDSPEYAAMQVQIGDLQRQNRRHECERTLTELQQRGVEFDMAEELAAAVEITDPEARKAHFGKIEKNYKRTTTPASLMHASSQAAHFAGSHVPATDQVMTARDLNRLSNKAAEFASKDASLTHTEAMSKAADVLGLKDKLGSILA